MQKMVGWKRQLRTKWLPSGMPWPCNACQLVQGTIYRIYKTSSRNCSPRAAAAGATRKSFVLQQQTHKKAQKNEQENFANDLNAAKGAGETRTS